MAPLMRCIVAVCAASRIAAVTWQKHAIPLAGELVLTDVHGAYDAGSDTVVVVATGEGGVVLKLAAPAANATGAWVVLLDTSFPLYWYGAYVFSPSNYLISGFLDGGGQAYGIVSFTADGGRTWSNDSRIDPSAWGGGPIEFANASEGYMPSTSGAAAWRTQTGGRAVSDWAEVTPSAGQWHAGNYVYDGSGRLVIAGSNLCNSSDFGVTWSCRPAVDASGMDSAVACAGAHCIIGGGEISPAVAGWAHVSTDGARSWSGTRALNAPYPVRTVAAVPTADAAAPPLLIAAGGNFFSAQGGFFSSSDGGATWAEDLDIGQEVKACRAVSLPTRTRVYCVSAGQSAGGIYSCDVPR